MRSAARTSRRIGLTIVRAMSSDSRIEPASPIADARRMPSRICTMVSRMVALPTTARAASTPSGVGSGR
jgi:hypothetical protein